MGFGVLAAVGGYFRQPREKPRSPAGTLLGRTCRVRAGPPGTAPASGLHLQTSPDLAGLSRHQGSAANSLPRASSHAAAHLPSCTPKARLDVLGWSRC